ncbi:hypothetical protein RRG08_015918 [Elysia crispata]|uniref:Uncharacterized protein n=1 Tax=Elysia crispata TaxID=231223 RepID=A0AAE1AMD2_9GAST|nr:hypothetical protein RRG08_015918 [Elysia crispata]
MPGKPGSGQAAPVRCADTVKVTSGHSNATVLFVAYGTLELDFVSCGLRLARESYLRSGLVFLVLKQWPCDGLGQDIAGSKVCKTAASGKRIILHKTVDVQFFWDTLITCTALYIQ